jgi:hypothetical protein
MNAREWVEIVAVSTLPLSLVGLLFNRWSSQKGLGVRAIQMLAVAMFMPTIIVLSMERLIDGSAVAALVGAVVGYLFANISEFDRSKPE